MHYCKQQYSNITEPCQTCSLTLATVLRKGYKCRYSVCRHMQVNNGKHKATFLWLTVSNNLTYPNLVYDLLKIFTIKLMIIKNSGMIWEQHYKQANATQHFHPVQVNWDLPLHLWDQEALLGLGTRADLAVLPSLGIPFHPIERICADSNMTKAKDT